MLRSLGQGHVGAQVPGAVQISGLSLATETETVNITLVKAAAGVTTTAQQGSPRANLNKAATGASNTVTQGTVRTTLAALPFGLLVTGQAGQLRTARTVGATGTGTAVLQGTTISLHWPAVNGQQIAMAQGNIPITTRQVPLQGAETDGLPGTLSKERLSRYITWVIAQEAKPNIIVEDTRFH
jgi:hypothetical protein